MVDNEHGTSGTDYERDLRDLIAEIENDNVIVVCGAGLSLAAPTLLPLGADVRRPFVSLVQEAIQTVDRELSPGLANSISFREGLIPSMPERVLGPFHTIFGDDVFTFLDPVFAASERPNHNHRNLGRLAATGHLTNIITLNFDFAIETAFKREAGTAEDPAVFSSAREYLERPQKPARLTIHKPHGTVRPGEEGLPRRVKYRDILFTVQRIGTALDRPLVDWLRDVVRDKSLLVTCYSSDDLDFFPALQHAMGCGTVFWNYCSGGPSALTEKWLRGLRSRARRMKRDINDILTSAVNTLCRPAVPQGGDLKPAPVSLDYLRRGTKDAVGTLLAAAIMCHLTEERRDAAFRDEILGRLDDGPARNIIKNDPSMAIQFDLLHAGPAHEGANISEALTRLRRAKNRIRSASRDDVSLPPDIEAQVDVNIAYNEAWPLKHIKLLRLLHPRAVLEAVLAICRLALWRRLPYRVSGERKPYGTQHLGEFLLNAGLTLDVALPWPWIPRLLYGQAFKRYKQATSRLEGFSAREHFHQMRLCEAQLHLLRGMPYREDSAGARAVNDILEHCRYLNGDPNYIQQSDGSTVTTDRSAMKGDVARGVHLILEAVRHSIKGERGSLRKALDEAWSIFEERGYGSGLYRVQMYDWILCCSNETPRLKLSLARRRLAYARWLRDWNPDRQRTADQREVPVLRHCEPF
jgi:hypothetical protein